MKQINIFGKVEELSEQKYSSKIESPIYDPKNIN